MTLSMPRVTAFALGLALAACAATVEESEWEPVASREYVAPDGGWRLELPAGWMRSGQTLTREGPERQTITFNAGPVLAEGSVPVDAATRPYLLQALQDELAAQPGTRVIAVGEAALDGLAGFRMHFVQAQPTADQPGTEPGAEREHLIQLAVDGNTLYALAYEAEPGEAFARDLPVFEALVASFRRSPGGT